MTVLNTEWWHPETLLHPVWLLVTALAAFRLTRVWVADMLPPLPRIRAAITERAENRWHDLPLVARTADSKTPEWQEAQREAEDAARSLGTNPIRVVGAHERAVRERQALYNGTPAVVELISCVWCSGYWIGAALALLLTWVPTVAGVWVAVPLALSAATGLFNQAADR